LFYQFALRGILTYLPLFKAVPIKKSSAKTSFKCCELAVNAKTEKKIVRKPVPLKHFIMKLLDDLKQ